MRAEKTHGSSDVEAQTQFQVEFYVTLRGTSRYVGQSIYSLTRSGTEAVNYYQVYPSSTKKKVIRD